MKRTIEDYLALSVTDCKRMGYFIPGARVTGVVSWAQGGQRVGEIGFGTNLTGIPVAVLAYTCNGRPIDDTIPLRFHNSNLAPGSSGTTAGYYCFVCPVTGRSCRKLYLHNGRFVSRHALGALYRQQAQSKVQRAGFPSFLRDVAKFDALTSQRYRRHTYNGRPTPYGLRVQRLESRLNGYISGGE